MPKQNTEFQKRIDRLTKDKRQLERAIREVLDFFGLEMDEGRLEVETFDQIANGLIKACHGDFQCELSEIKRKWKFILDQCERVGR